MGPLPPDSQALNAAWKEEREAAARKIQRAFRNYFFRRELFAAVRANVSGQRGHSILRRADAPVEAWRRKTGKQLWAKVKNALACPTRRERPPVGRNLTTYLAAPWPWFILYIYETGEIDYGRVTTGESANGVAPTLPPRPDPLGDIHLPRRVVLD